MYLERDILSCLAEAESRSVRVEVMLKADCLSVRIDLEAIFAKIPLKQVELRGNISALCLVFLH